MQLLAGIITESQLDENTEAQAWLVDEENGLPKILRFASEEAAKDAQFDEMADEPYNRPLFTSLEDLKNYLDQQYMADYNVELYRYLNKSSLNEETSSVSDETYGEMDNLIYTDHKDDYDNFISSATNIMDTLVKNNFKVEDIFDYLKSRLEAEV